MNSLIEGRKNKDLVKKNGKKYRKLLKEKESRRKKKDNIKIHIFQEVNDMNMASLALAHIVIFNPVMKDSVEIKREYLRRLNGYMKAAGRNKRKFESAELKAYEKIIMGAQDTGECHDISYYKYYILLDLMQILAYEFKPADFEKMKIVKERYRIEFEDHIDLNIVNTIFKITSNSDRKIKQLLNEPNLVNEKEYIQLIQKNILFKKKEPVGVMVTATMSAGKSAFINALVGKYVCLSQNMACTSKIHCIVNKAFEDGFSAEYDHDLVLTAGREELLNDNELNLSDKIIVSTNFIGELADQRIIVNDSPGVNYSGDEKHKEITERLIKGKNYNLLIYVMNATQLATNDESDHLDYVKKTVGRRSVLFIINKIDAFNIEEENIEFSIQRQSELLKKKGFKDPVICPISSRAGYLAKQFKEGKLSRTEERELYNYIDKFEQMRLVDYYAKAFKDIFVEDAENEEAQLLKTCGLAYVEKIIIVMCKGGNLNGSGKH